MELSRETEKLLILKLLNLETPKESSRNINNSMLGKRVLVRTYSAGVHFGTLKEKVGQEAILTDSRRVYSWVEACSLSQLAMEGSKKISSCKIAMSVKEILLNRVIEVIPLTDEANNQLSGAEEWKK